MNALTYVFPIVTILFIALFYLGCPALKTCNLESTQSKQWSRRDTLCLGLIAILYAAVAFYNLGNTDSPQSFRHFESGDSVIIDLGKETQVDEFMYFSGLSTGSYILEYSRDCASWYNAAILEQNHVAIFKWMSAEFNDGVDAETRYIRITAKNDMYMGEVAVKSGGEPVAFSCSAPELIDEQELVPEYQYFLNSTYFDEIYHARTAAEHIEGIYPYEISHPPLGKLIIAIGIQLFGLTPFGWRFSGALFGVLMLPILYVFLKKMFGGTAVPACATAIFAFDFMHFAQTRIATIDTYAVFFILLMYLFMYLYIVGGKKRYLALSGIFFGIGAACKWTCFYAGAGLAVIWLFYCIRNLSRKQFFRNCLFCTVFFVLIPCMIYYICYFPYGTAKGLSAPGMFFSKEYADIVWGNQEFMFSYHSGVHSEHPYSSRWYQWIIDQRPILYYLKHYDDGTRSSFGAFLNPVLCWAGLVAIFIMGYLAIFRKDRQAEFIAIGYLAQLLPWVFITRTTFEYHYFPACVFLVLALGRVFALMKEHTKDWRFRIYGLTGLAVILFTVFYPALSGMVVNSSLASSLLKWMPSWPF